MKPLAQGISGFLSMADELLIASNQKLIVNIFCIG